MVTGVILAGGQSRRMGGQAKGLLVFEGEPLIARQVRTMRAICEEIIVIANDPGLYRMHIPADVKMAGDLTPQSGPLGGMEAALASTRGDPLWIVGCDMPCISSEAASLLLRQLDDRETLEAAIPSIEGKLHPLHGVYKRSIELKVRQLVKTQQLRLMGLFEQISWLRVEELAFQEAGLALTFAANINTPEEWRKLQHQGEAQEN